MMPVFARDLFHGNAQTYGFLIGSAGFGSLCAAFFLAWRGGKHASDGLDRLVGRTALTGGIALACFAFVPLIQLAYPLLMILGFSVVLTAAGSNTLIQIDVEEEYRGRVMAIFSTAFLGIAPLGSLTVGLVSEMLDVRPTLLVCGLLAFSAGLIYRRRMKVAT
jgi:predicted MFS family arabinose efflux permease